MRYAEFRDQLEHALQEAGLFFHGVDRPVETIDLADTVRRWKVYVYRASPRSEEPFHVSAEISFYWTPADAARALVAGMTPEERQSSKTLVYQCLPSRYGFDPDQPRGLPQKVVRTL